MKVKKVLLASIIALSILMSAQVAGAQLEPKKSKVVAAGELTIVKEVAKPSDAGTVVGKEIVSPEIEIKGETKSNGLSWWQVLLRHLMELVFTVLGIMATATVTVLFRKYGFEAQASKVNEVLDKATGFAEQWSVKKLKLEGKPAEGVAKLEMAVKMAQALAKDYKLPARSSGWWEDRLESWLGSKK